MSSHPILVFGGALIGNTYNTQDEVSALLDKLKSTGIGRIDTAARYPPTNPGASERLLGEAGAAKLGFLIDTKVMASGDGSGSLEPAAIEHSVRISRERLKLQQNRINVLFTHMPDPKTPLERQAAGLDAEYRRGFIKQIGISNFPPQLLSDFLDICDKRGYVKPTVYQGRYNLIHRDPEKSIFPILRQHGMTFHAYSPLAGGFLTGRLTAGETEGTRFAEGNILGQSIRGQYDHKEMHDAVGSLNRAIEHLGISKIEASLRWICFHSALTPDDAVILGASKPSQLQQNVEGISKGPLPDAAVAAINDIWRIVSRPE